MCRTNTNLIHVTLYVLGTWGTDTDAPPWVTDSFSGPEASCSQSCDLGIFLLIYTYNYYSLIIFKNKPLQKQDNVHMNILPLCKSEGRTFLKQIFTSIKYENLANITDHKVINKVFSSLWNHFHFRKKTKISEMHCSILENNAECHCH